MRVYDLLPVPLGFGLLAALALFSCYILLSLLIVGVAWFKSWRPLNLSGFFFTFGVGTVWGVLSYIPQNFASTEPSLIAFFWRSPHGGVRRPPGRSRLP